MKTCCRECDKTSLDINLKGLRDFRGQWSISIGYIKDYTQLQRKWNDLLRLNTLWTLGWHSRPYYLFVWYKWVNKRHGACFIMPRCSGMVTPGSTLWKSEGDTDESIKYNTHASLSTHACVWPVSVSRKHLYEHVLRNRVWCVNNIKQVTLRRKQSR